MLVSYFYPVSGNCITIAVMRKKEFTQTFHKLLTALAVFDNIFIASAIFTLAIRLPKVINIILFGCCRTFSLLDNPKFWFLIPMFLPMIILGSFAMISSMYLTLAIRWHRNEGFLIQVLMLLVSALSVLLVSVIHFIQGLKYREDLLYTFYQSS